MKLYLIRHGETDWNQQRRLQGREDIPLNENGKLQGRLCAEVFKGKKIRAIITSPLLRAKDTARIMADILGIDKVIIEEGMIERDFGKISGLFPAERKAFYISGEEADLEPLDELSFRLMNCLKNYMELYRPDSLIIISHGASINSILSVLSEGEIGTGKTRLTNSCINIIDCESGEMKLTHYNLSPEEFKNLSDTGSPVK